MHLRIGLLCVCGLLTAMSTGAEEMAAIKDEADFFGNLDLERTDLAEVRKAVLAEDWEGAKTAWGAYLEEILANRWLWSHRERVHIMEYLEAHNLGFKHAPKKADKILLREFNHQGVERILKKDIIWESEEYGYEWGNVLNRHGYWRTMGEAWWLTGEAKYAQDWALMVRDWIKDNPVPVKTAEGGPWRSLEAGVRVEIWFDAMSLFMNAPACDASLRYDLTRLLVEHARYLYNNNTYFKKGNWQVVECSGLAFAGIVLSAFKESAAWRQRAFSMMLKHMADGVYPDGAHYELTPTYHNLVVRKFLKLIILAKKNGYEIPELNVRHEKMFEFLMHIAKPDRRYMALGDTITGGSGGSIADSMGRGALLYGRPDMRYLGSDNPVPSWVWNFSMEEIEGYAALTSQEPELRSHMMPDAKYGVMRTGWGKNDRWLLFDCAPWGGGHGHQDQLQVLLYSGRDLLMDSGQVSYDNPLSRSYFRTAQAHNVLLVNGHGPSRKESPEVVAWSIGDRVEFASGKLAHNGVTHQRSVLFVKPDYWVVVDHVGEEGTAELTRLFHLSLGEVEQDGNTVRTTFKDGDNLWICAVDKPTVEIREGLLAGGTGQNKGWNKAPVAAFVSKQSLPAVLGTVLLPFGDEKDIPDVKWLTGAYPDTAAITVTFKDGRTDHIVIAPEVREIAAGGHKGRGMALYVRTGAGEPTVDFIQP